MRCADVGRWRGRASDYRWGMGVVAVEVVVRGHVQGVFFRARAQEEAERLGVRGWARNEPDGTVRAHLEGSSDAVEQMVDWCHQGSPRARVDDVARRDRRPEGHEHFVVN